MSNLHRLIQPLVRYRQLIQSSWRYLQTWNRCGKDMSRRTVQTQRKVKIPSGLKKRLEKAKLEKTVKSPVIESPAIETAGPSCEISGCGCGN